MKIIILLFLFLLTILIIAGFIIQILHFLEPVFWLFKKVLTIFIKPVESCVYKSLYGVNSYKFNNKLLAFYGLKKAYAVRLLPWPLIIARHGFFPKGKVIQACIRARNRL